MDPFFLSHTGVVAILVLLIVWAKLNPFLSLLDRFDLGWFFPYWSRPADSDRRLGAEGNGNLPSVTSHRDRPMGANAGKLSR